MNLTPSETTVPGPATLPTPPEGTALLTIGRIRLGSHRRGGKREHVARVAPADLRAALLSQAPGRYRVACLNRRGHFVAGGSFVVEVSGGTHEPVKVQARTPGDYPRRPVSAEHGIRRGTQRIEQRNQVLQADLREAYTARARAERVAATQREQHSRESLHLHATVETLVEQVERLVDRVKELEAQQDERQRKGRADLTRVREELANERRQREDVVARLAADIVSLRGASPVIDREPRWSTPGVVGSGSASVDHGPAPIAASPAPPVPGPPPRTVAPGFAALANVRAVVQQPGTPGERSSTSAGVRSPDYVEGLDDFFRLRPPRPK